MPVLDIKTTALEPLKPLTSRSFIKSSLTVSTWEHSISLSRSFLQMEAENQNFPQMISFVWCVFWWLFLVVGLWKLSRSVIFLLVLLWCRAYVPSQIVDKLSLTPHTSLDTPQKLLRLGWEVMLHPPYSSDLSPSDYYLFQYLQTSLNGKTFNDDEAVKSYLVQFFAD